MLQKLQTDQYGNTQTIDLHAPSKKHGLKKPEVKPYSQYIVTAQHPGFAPVQWIGSQIFEGSKAIPTIKLPPLQMNSYASSNWFIPKETTRKLKT
ncbi:hypothetical protein [Paenibacillus sp. A3]|uniref:hypothetical protein n=1 Tax=Paenibacillus sp. A3 TaxID=1337054 RepID=UPI0012F9F2FF|nr:hypothetical protein [Paenibacillus sp. A3]